MTDTTDLIQRMRTAWTYCGVEQALRFEAADALEQQAADAHIDKKNLDCLYRTIDELTAETEQQAAQIAALRADAERYRWLRKSQHWPCVFASHYDPEPLRAEYLDDALDAALRQEQPTKGEGA